MKNNYIFKERKRDGNITSRSKLNIIHSLKKYKKIYKFFSNIYEG